MSRPSTHHSAPRDALPPPAGIIHRSIHLLGSALEEIEAKIAPREVERLAVMVNRAMTLEGRSFHTPEHVLGLADPGNPHITLAALFHDLVYYQVDLGFLPEIAETVAASIEVGESEVSVRARVDPSDAPLRACLEVFGFREGQKLSPLGGMNEFLSAMVMIRKLTGIVRPLDLLLATACIETTIPFRKPDAAGLSAAQRLAGRLAGAARLLRLELSPEKIDLAVQQAVTFANRDVENFADPEVTRFLDNTWKLLPETNPSLRTQGVYTIASYRVAIQKMEGFLGSLDPALIFGQYRGVPSAETLGDMVRRAERNVFTARAYLGTKLLTVALLEALAEVSGGDAPVSLFMGEIGSTQAGSRLADYLPAAGSPPAAGVDRTLYDLLAYGRAGASSFDLQNSPLSLYVYLRLGSAGTDRLLEAARQMFAGELSPRAFLDGLPDELVSPVALGCARMAFTRAHELESYLGSREGRKGAS